MTEIDRSLLRAQSLEDRVVSTLKTVVGGLPVVGNGVVELFTVLIPNQRIDRLANFCEQLAAALEARTQTPEAFLAKYVESPAFAVLTEDILSSAARSVSDQRRQHLAALLVNGISMDAANLEMQATLTKLLDRLTDSQVIILISYAGFAQTFGNQAQGAFTELHAAVFPEQPEMGCSTDDLDRWALFQHLRGELEALGLLRVSGRRLEAGPLGKLLTKQVFGRTEDDDLG